MDQDAKRIALELVSEFIGKKVLVIGDLIVDEYEHVIRTGCSLEHPAAPKYSTHMTDISLGGAANVVKNIVELGGDASFITLLGDDLKAAHAYSLEEIGVKLLAVHESGRSTTVKRRTWTGGKCIIQVDTIDNRDLSDESEVRILRLAEDEMRNVNRVLLIDYRHRMMSHSLISGLKRLVELNGNEAIASSQMSQCEPNHLEYSGVSLVCMNAKEARALDPDFELTSDCSSLEEALRSNICVTLGDKGSMLRLGGKTFTEPVISVVEKDSCGAGDCFLAALSLADFAKSPELALYVANCWAALSIQIIGTGNPSKKDLLRCL